MSYPDRRDPRPATARQIAYIDALIRDREVGMDDLPDELFERLLDVGGRKMVSTGDASALITSLKALPIRQTPARAVEDAKAADRATQAEPGYYSLDGQFYVIVQNRRKTSTYAKRLEVTRERVVDEERFDMQRGGSVAHIVVADDDPRGEFRTRARWEYAPGIGARLATAARLSMEEAAAFGHLHGICAICCATLTDPKSVERGIGPICAKRVAA